MGSSINSFFRFALGFGVFLAVSLGLTYAVETYSMKREREAETAAAFRAMLNIPAPHWWEIWK